MNRNNGMLESWIDGFKETSIQNAYYFIFSCPIFHNSTIPSFHTAYQENGRKKYCDSNKL
jgi:hypothetical protein